MRHNPERIAVIRNLIRSGSVDWERVVWVSTGHLVFPALYLQLKRAGLLTELPTDLMDYMESYTSQNRDRNQQILDQAHQVAALLNKQGINPVFLKGTAHLLDQLYEDIAERMVGDIDLLVNENEMVKAAELLMNKGYEPLSLYNPKDMKMTKHYPRLIHNHKIAAVEIHRQLLMFPWDKDFDGRFIIRNSRKLELPGSVYVPCDAHQIIHNILNFQINDFGYYYGWVSLRQGYDLFLLSQHENPLTITRDFGRFCHRMNGNLAANAHLFGHPECISLPSDWRSYLFTGRIVRNLTHLRWSRFSYVILYLLLRFSHYFRILIRISYNKEARSSLFTRLSDPKWYCAHIRSYKKIF